MKGIAHSLRNVLASILSLYLRSYPGLREKLHFYCSGDHATVSIP